MIIRCKRCGIRFEFQEAEAAFYSSRGWPKPKTCLTCRAERRIEKASPYYGIEEAFSNYTPCKKGDSVFITDRTLQEAFDEKGNHVLGLRMLFFIKCKSNKRI